MNGDFEVKSLHEHMKEYQRQLAKGDIRAAYRGLMEYSNSLRLYFKKKYPDHSVSGSVYNGFLDMTYFSFTSKSLKQKN